MDTTAQHELAKEQPLSPGPRLTLSGISKSFPGVRALHDVSLSLYAGQVTALIGENGAGKSTLVKAMTGVQLPDGGEVLIDGAAVNGHEAQRRADALRALDAVSRRAMVAAINGMLDPED
jgi:rhamnose transport system ATP-binding protein